MPSTKEYLEYVLDLLSEVKHISFKKMMGEYILYEDGIYFATLCDNRFLIKKTESNNLGNFKEERPYEGAKKMYLVDIEDKEKIQAIVQITCKELMEKK